LFEPIFVPSIEPPSISILGIVPKLVNEEDVTVEPMAVFDKISVPSTLYTLPDAIFICSLEFHALVTLLHEKVLSTSLPASNVIPPPSAVVLDGFVVAPKRIFTSDTSTSLLLIVVVVP